MKLLENKSVLLIGIVAVILVLYVLSTRLMNDPMTGFASGNGRIEATDIDIATKLAGRVEAVNVEEGDFVTKGQPLAVMQLSVLEAQLREAEANHVQAQNSALSAKARTMARESDKMAAEAVVLQRQSELTASKSRLKRITNLVNKGAVSEQDLDDQKANVQSLEAAIATAKAQVAAAEAAIVEAQAEAVGANSSVQATKATIERIEADIADSTLIAPIDARVQYKISQPGEVLNAGGKVMNIIDLSDVYMTFFLPEKDAGMLSLGTEARLVLDVAPQFAIPAKITFVASQAQFTPKTVETESERQKLMFRVKAQIDKALLLKHKEFVKTGLPGIVWVKIDPAASWPAHLQTNIPESSQKKEEPNTADPK